MSRCQRTFWGEGYSGRRWVCLTADCGSKVYSFRQWAAANCAVLPTANAGQYVALHCKPLVFCNYDDGGDVFLGNGDK